MHASVLTECAESKFVAFELDATCMTFRLRFQMNRKIGVGAGIVKQVSGDQVITFVPGPGFRCSTTVGCSGANC